MRTRQLRLKGIQIKPSKISEAVDVDVLFVSKVVLRRKRKYELTVYG